MKCLLVASIFPPVNGGSAVVYENLCRFSADGNIHVLAPRCHYLDGKPIKDWQAFDAKANYPIHRVKYLRPPVSTVRSFVHSLFLVLFQDLPIKLRVLIRVMRLHWRHRYSILCIGELNSGTWLGLFCRRVFGIPFINYIHGEEITTTTRYRSFGRWRRYYLQQADGIVAVSQFTKQALIAQMGIPEAKITLIENGVDAERFQPGPRPPTLLARYRLEDKKVLLTVGRIVERKGIDMTLKALPAIIQACPDVHYLIVGDGDYRVPCEAMTTALGLTAYVTFAGLVPADELVDHYRLCDVFIMPNRELANHDTEGFGLVFREANACAKPVISGTAGGAVEAVRDGINGVNVDGNDPSAISATVIRLLTDEPLRQRIAAAGLTLARAESSQESARRFYALCETIVKPTDANRSVG